MELTKREKRKFKQGNVVEGQQAPLQQLHEKETEKISNKRYYIIATIVVLLAFIAYSAYSFAKPSPYGNFAKCLKEKGAVMYGAMSWCKYTQAQKGMFGKSFRHIDYYEYQDLPGIKVTPTWVINGQWHENVQSFESLAQLTGCTL